MWSIALAKSITWLRSSRVSSTVGRIWKLWDVMKIRKNMVVAIRSLIGYPSFSAAGEDRLVIAWLRVIARMKMSDVRYCDIGANHPKYLSNTFALYRSGASGVLIEPDPLLCAKLRSARPRDSVVNVGVAFDDRTSAKLQRLSDRAFNTFLPEQANFVVRSSEKLGDIEPATNSR